MTGAPCSDINGESLMQIASKVLTLLVVPAVAFAQHRQTASAFLFASQPSSTQPTSMAALDAGFNERAFEPVAGERWEQRANALLTLNSLVAINGQLGFARTPNGETQLAQQFEVLTTPLAHGAFSLGANVGWRHEYTGANVGLLRLVGARGTARSSIAADLLLEHPYAAGRDGLDVITTVGASRALSSRVWLGVEAVGSDLEGFFDREEAEGGATLLVGPSVAIGLAERWRLVVGGGPVLRVTNNAAPTPMGVSPLAPQRSGYVLRTSLRVGW